MDDFIIRTLCNRGSNHPNHCEDSFLLHEDDRFVYAAVFDGCSSGKDSHFASTLHSRILRKILVTESPYKNEIYDESSLYDLSRISTTVFYIMLSSLTQHKYTLGLEIDELLSTIVFLVIDKTNNNYCIKLVGDGCYFINGVKHNIESVDNAPEYLAYAIDGSTEKVFSKITSIVSSNFDKVNDIAITTDGINTFNLLQMRDASKQKEIEDFLFNDQLLKSAVTLERKCNILLNKNITHSDDLSIIMFKRQKTQIKDV